MVSLTVIYGWGMENNQAAQEAAMNDKIKCPTCKVQIPLNANGALELHHAGRRKVGACPSSLLSVTLVKGGRK